MYYVLNPELRREKDQIVRDGLEMFFFITVHLGALLRRKRAFTDQEGWEEFYWLTDNQ